MCMAECLTVGVRVHSLCRKPPFDPSRCRSSITHWFLASKPPFQWLSRRDLSMALSVHFCNAHLAFVALSRDHRRVNIYENTLSSSIRYRYRRVNMCQCLYGAHSLAHLPQNARKVIGSRTAEKVIAAWERHCS